jgi:cobalt-zinc-cadmium efflux system outer membrane protein
MTNCMKRGLLLAVGLALVGSSGCTGIDTNAAPPPAASAPRPVRPSVAFGKPSGVTEGVIPAGHEELPVPKQSAPGEALAVADLEQMALIHNPTIAAAEALVRQQIGLMRQAGLYPNPTFGYVRTDADQTGQSQTNGVFVSQDIVTAGKLTIARTEQQQYVEWRDWQLKAQRGRVLNDVRIRYYEVLGAQEAVRIATEFEQLALKGVELTEQIRKAGQGSRLDVVQAEIQLSAVRTTLQDAKVRAHAAWQQLANVVGVRELPEATLTGSLEDAIPTLDWETSLKQLYAASPLLRAQEAQLRGFQYDLKLARAEAIPNVNVQLVAQRDYVLKYTSVSTLVSMPVPFFNRNQGNIQQSMGQLDQQQKEYDRIKLAIADQLAGAFQQYQTARGQSERLRSEILPKTKESLDLTTTVYKNGQTDFLRVLNAQHSYLEARMGYIDALTALHKAAIEIVGLELTGGLNPTEIGTALQTMPGAAGTGARGVLLQQLQQQGPGATGRLPGALQGAAK